MDNKKLIFAILGAFALGFVIYWLFNKYQTSRLSTDSNTGTGDGGSTSSSTSTSTSTSTGIGPNPNSAERGLNVLKSFSKGGNIITYGQGGQSTKGTNKPFTLPPNSHYCDAADTALSGKGVKGECYSKTGTLLHY